MQVPEKLSLIGGSILLASTLIFTLKSQASNILPKVDSGMSSLVNDSKSGQSSNDSSQKQQQAQADQAFNSNFQQAQQKGWQTGQWGDAKFYVDGQGTMHVGSGKLNGSFTKLVNENQIKNIGLEGHEQAPQDSSYLFADSRNEPIPLNQINGLSNLDTSQATSMDEMFERDSSLSSLDLSHFDTSHVTHMNYMFFGNSNLNNLDVSHFDTSHVTYMNGMFDSDSSLSSLDLSHFDTSHVIYMEYMFDYDNIHQLSLGSNTKLQNSGYSGASLSDTYQNNGQTSSLVDGNAHPGTWIRQ